MAVIETSRSVYGSASVANRVFAFFAAVFSVAAHWNDARVTRNTLSALSDRELEDIGLSRGDISVMAEGRK